MKPADVVPLVKRTWSEFQADKAMTLGAALAFYTALSIAPLLLLVTVIAGVAFGEQATRGEIAHQLNDLIGAEGAKAVEAMLVSTQSPGGSLLSTVVGIVTLLLGATGVFTSLQDALNTVWNVKPDDTGTGLRRLIRDRLASFSMVCAMAFLLLVSLVFSAVLNALGGVVNRWVPFGDAWMGAANLGGGFLVTALMFATIYKYLPHARPDWSDVGIGAVITAGLFTLGKYLIGLYLGTASIGSTYGAAGSFVVLLVWIYYSSLIVLFGAEFTQVYAQTHGSGLTPAGRRRLAGAPAPVHT